MPDMYQQDRPIRLTDTQERWAYGIAGAALLTWGMRRGPLSRLLAMAVGGGMLYRLVTGRSPLDKIAGMMPEYAQGHGSEIYVNRSVTVNAEPQEVYDFWRDFENLPRFMQHLESVHKIDERRSRWCAFGPAGTRVEWEAEVVREEPGHEIAWQSLPGSTVSNRGVVTFRPAPSGQGTEIEVRMEYRPPGGRLGAAMARMFGEEPQLQVEDDLQRLRRMIDAGEWKSASKSSATDEHRPGGSSYLQ
jgi:uncharacterized membrane protein